MTKSDKDIPIPDDFTPEQFLNAATLGRAATKGRFPDRMNLVADRGDIPPHVWIAGKHPANKAREE